MSVERPITRGLVWALGASQLVCWGVSYYVIAVFGAAIGAELGWSQTVTYGGFSAALLVMGLVSPAVGRAVDRRGGRRVMVAGSCLTALACIGLSLAHDLAVYYAAWLLFGLSMRMTLYDAAFAALARIGGKAARRPISQITLLGGLASTVFWPIGHALSDAFGWRAALLAYAACALATVPLHLVIPVVAEPVPGPVPPPDAAAPAEPQAAAAAARDERLAGLLYALIVTATSFLNSGISAGMIDLLTGLGLAAGAAVWISTLRGIGQSLARLCEIAFGRRLSPLALGMVATALLVACFLAGPFGGVSVPMAVAFAFLYGAGNGLVTIVRGTMPLVLFDPRSYGTRVGRLLAPSFYLAAVAPICFALLVERFGEIAAFALSGALAALALAAAFLLWLRFRGSV